MNKNHTLSALLAATCLLAAPGVAAADPSERPTPEASAEAPQKLVPLVGHVEKRSASESPQMYTRYLLNSEHVGSWSDDGVKGIVKNFSKKRIVVKDTTCGKSLDIWPGQAVVFYADQDLKRFAGLDAGDGTWLEISEYDNPAMHSEFRLSDAWIGRPDTLFWGPGRSVQNVRKSWNEGDSHHEITNQQRFWVKRENDSWKEKFDNWNTSDWPAFTIHVDQM